MPESTSAVTPGQVAGYAPSGLGDRVRSVGAGLTALLDEAEAALERLRFAGRPAPKVVLRVG